jgi:inorganic triphosphatase YgiF
MRSDAGEELELKLEFTSEELQRIGANPALEPLTVGKPESRTLHSIYFDTPDHRLRAHGVSLRLRSTDAGEWLQTIKVGNGMANGLSQRQELEAKLSKPEPDLEAIRDRKLRRRIEQAVGRSTLEPLFETVVNRTVRKLHCDKGDLELALDEGFVRAGQIEDPLCEAELELKAGSAASLLETATTIFGAEPCRLAHGSKADRGYNLMLGRRDGSVLPQRAVHPVLQPDQTCAEALSLFVESCSDQIVANRQVVLETNDPEGAHQLRIGLRRLRTALRAFRLLDDTPALRALETYARDLARIVGRLRDADVLIEEIHAQVSGNRKNEPGFGELRQGLLAYRAKTRDDIRAALVGEQWSKLQLYLVLWPSTMRASASLQTPVRDFAASALQKSWKKVDGLGVAIDELSLEQRHDMRKALKTFRYTVELFGSLYASKKVVPFVRELKKLQDCFGYINDVATAKQLNAIAPQYCPGSDGAQRAAGYVLGWHEAEATHRWAIATKEWHRLKDHARFWR